MARFSPPRFQTIFTRMIARIVARTNLSDVGDSSVVKHLLATAAESDDELSYQMLLLLTLFSIDTATGDDLDARAAEIQPGTITRLAATKASGHVVFSRTGVAGSVSIPIGTRVKTGDGVEFTTTAAGSITVGNTDSAPVPIVAVLAGLSGTVEANTIVRFVSKPAGVNTVTNPDPTLYGTDRESDDAFRQRIKDYVASLARSTPNALENAVLGLEDPETGAVIKFSKVVEDQLNLGFVVLYIDDGTGGALRYESLAVAENVTAGLAGPPPDSAVGGEEVLYLDNWPVVRNTLDLESDVRGALVEGTHYTLNYANGQLVFDPPLVAAEVITANDYDYYVGLIALAQKVVDGDPLDRQNYPGYRAAGVLVEVQTPQVVIQNVEAVLAVTEGFDRATKVAEAQSAVSAYINGLGISGDVVRNELIARIMNINGIFNVTLETPAADVILLDNQLARTTSVNIDIR